MAQWKQIGESNYRISDDGRVFSVRSNRILKAHPNRAINGYMVVHLTISGAPKTYYVHHLVATAFIGPRPDGLFLNHKDGNKRNNSATNLEYCTRRQNFDHAIQHGLTLLHEKHPQSKLTVSKVQEIREKRQNGVSARELAREYGVHRHTIHRVMRGGKEYGNWN